MPSPALCLRQNSRTRNSQKTSAQGRIISFALLLTLPWHYGERAAGCNIPRQVRRVYCFNLLCAGTPKREYFDKIPLFLTRQLLCRAPLPTITPSRGGVTQARHIAKLLIHNLSTQPVRSTRFARKFNHFTLTDTVVHEILGIPRQPTLLPRRIQRALFSRSTIEILSRDISSFNARACTPQTLWTGDGASFRSSVPSLAGRLLILPVAYPTVPGQPRTCTYIGLETT